MRAGITLLVVTLMGWGALVAMVVTPAWLVSLLAPTPVVALLSFLLGVIGSSRACDAKTAQNLVLAIVFPVFGLIALQVTGALWFGPVATLALAVGLTVADYLVLHAAVGLFRREAIVLKWR